MHLPVLERLVLAATATTIVLDGHMRATTLSDHTKRQSRKENINLAFTELLMHLNNILCFLSLLEILLLFRLILHGCSHEQSSFR